MVNRQDPYRLRGHSGNCLCERDPAKPAPYRIFTWNREQVSPYLTRIHRDRLGSSSHQPNAMKRHIRCSGVRIVRPCMAQTVSERTAIGNRHQSDIGSQTPGDGERVIDRVCCVRAAEIDRGHEPANGLCVAGCQAAGTSPERGSADAGWKITSRTFRRRTPFGTRHSMTLPTR